VLLAALLYAVLSTTHLLWLHYQQHLHFNAAAIPAIGCSFTRPADILPGWGLSIDPDNFALFKATRPCPADTYGVANETFGLQSAPCKACTKNLKAAPGSTSYADCKNRAGFGYTTEGANQVCMQC
jgi:hypothetical protein